MTLLEQVQEKSKEIHTDGYPMSIGELASIYKDGELDIHPDFQRIFRWNDVQKSKLIESILLGIPIPSIFVSQRENGIWDVVDGLQRLSTIFEFMEILKDENGNNLPGSTLVSTPHLDKLAGFKWNNSNKQFEIDSSLKLEIKRVKIDVKIVKKQSDKNVKFELFQRINTLGSRLSDQEVRNCLLIMINKEFYHWLKSISNNENFLNTISLADRLIEEQYHIELALRYFIYKNIALSEIKGVTDLSEFITDKMIKYAEDTTFDKDKEKAIFEGTFAVLNKILGEDVFKRYVKANDRFQGKFLLSLFETISIGVGKNLEKSTLLDENEILNSIKKIWESPDFLTKYGSGVNVTSRLPVLIPLGEKIFSNEA
jgi:uncharacterized protein with ParB-like and HNH nuclease domain